MGNDDLLHFRLRTERSRIRISKLDVEKQIRKKYRELENLQNTRRKLPWLPLEKPYQKGFVRFFVLRDDVLYSKDAAFFNEILNVINSYMYSDTRKFQKRKRKFGKKIYVNRIQKTKEIDLYHWLDPKLELSDRHRQYFRKVEEYCPFTKRNKTCYQFIEPWRFVLRTRPNIITQYKPIIAEMEREIAEISHVLDQYKTQGILRKKIFGGNYSWKSKKEIPNPIASKKHFFLQQSALEIAENYLDNCSKER